MLTDFGFTRNMAADAAMILWEGHRTTDFMAPELLLPRMFGLEKEVPSKKADIYALGMTIYQVLTGRWPFFTKRETEVVHVVISGERPPKPWNAGEIGMTDVVWELLKECWREDRTTRPGISKVLGVFCDITGERNAPDPTAQGTTAPQLDAADNQNPGTGKPSNAAAAPGYTDEDEVSEAKEGVPPSENLPKTQTSYKQPHRGTWVPCRNCPTYA